ncbi:MAG: PilZ domain-containing protein [Spirochaetaceae bacterium]|nr:MAG: PilZ domain-containing protein [Spirochaetaceae bacterium]
MNASVERRKCKRVKYRIQTVIRKDFPDGRHIVMEFATGNLSAGGVFIIVEDLSLFDLGEELSASLCKPDKQIYEGRVRVVRSMRIFSPENNLTESGFGLMFLEQVNEVSSLVEDFLKEQQKLVL